MKRTEVIVIGGGQAGLAMSRCLHERGIGHVVLERGRVGERWRSERWDSARLLSPNWQSRLPGYRYGGDDPDGYMMAADVAGYLEGYARSFECPLLTGTMVEAVERSGDDYVVRTDRGTWTAQAVVVATGACGTPYVPEMADGLSDAITQLDPTRYRNPGQLPPGGVLVVGASASGIQLADELVQSGRSVTLAVGRHRRAPRRWRGRDIMRWLDEIGLWGQELEAPRVHPSLQLVGSDDYRDLDLGMLRDRGVQLAGHAIEMENDRVRFADDLAETMAEADAKLLSLIARIETWIAERGLTDSLPPAGRVALLAPPPGPDSLDLRVEGYGTVLWATGFRPRYPWLKVPVLDGRGQIRQKRGVAEVPGLYVLGLPFLRRRNSNTIDGVGRDAVELADHLAAWLERPGRAAA